MPLHLMSTDKNEVLETARRLAAELEDRGEYETTFTIRRNKERPEYWEVVLGFTFPILKYKRAGKTGDV
jgi:hypothetical protein